MIMVQKKREMKHPGMNEPLGKKPGSVDNKMGNMMWLQFLQVFLKNLIRKIVLLNVELNLEMKFLKMVNF